ncbi:DUF1615 family protein [Aquitalea sp.]|uniref:DUF1615 family protein n=1 Tax=Aquitalea sp. TaxID=1872623 RepID=UPI002588996E|nr:DUF1615 family protein [Aquitalea sp.]
MYRYLSVAALLGLTGCAATVAPVAQPVPVPAPVLRPAPMPDPQSLLPAPVVKPVQPAPVVVAPVSKPVPLPLQPAYANEKEGSALLDKLLPRGIPARREWHGDIMTAFSHLKIPYAPQYFCAVLAVAEQESGFNPDPVVPNLSRIVWGQIEERRQKYFIPALVVDAAMLKKSPNGQTYKERVNALRTKKQMNALFEDMIRELPFGQTIFEHKNPIRDGGPMQVSVAFAETQVRAWPYPYSYTSLRDEVFSLRGSVYFGTAILLQYPISYPDMVYRFADYNAGRYASRNAAFQQAVQHLSGQKLALDGDIMLYSDKMNRVLSGATSDTQRALNGLAGRLRLSPDEMARDLRQEKLAVFSQTEVYKRVFTLAEQSGRAAPRQIIPQIVLVSPKFTHQLTTEWFARRVDGRYQNCMARGGFH